MMMQESFYSNFQSLENRKSRLDQRVDLFYQNFKYWTETEVLTILFELWDGIEALIDDLALFRDEEVNDRAHQTRMVRMYYRRIYEMMDHLNWMYDELRGFYLIYPDSDEEY